MGTRFHKMGDDFDLCEEEFAKLPEDDKMRYEVFKWRGAQPVPYAEWKTASSLPGMAVGVTTWIHGTIRANKKFVCAGGAGGSSGKYGTAKTALPPGIELQLAKGFRKYTNFRGDTITSEHDMWMQRVGGKFVDKTTGKPLGWVAWHNSKYGKWRVAYQDGCVAYYIKATTTDHPTPGQWTTTDGGVNPAPIFERGSAAKAGTEVTAGRVAALFEGGKLVAPRGGAGTETRAMLKVKRAAKRQAAPAQTTNSASHGGADAAAPASAAAANGALPAAWASLPTSIFPPSQAFPEALISYQTNSTGEQLGKHWVWALAHELRDHNIATFNGYQVQSGENWVTEYFGVIPECKVLVAMLSKSYFQSRACLKELITAIEQEKPVIPIFLEAVNTEGHFLGESTQQIKLANLIRIMVLSRNCVPPPDQGFFPGADATHFKRNAKMLAGAIREYL